MSEKMDRQFDLEDGNGARLTCWLRDDLRLKVGVAVTLKETGARRWRIVHRYQHTVPDADANWHWNVGGIQTRRSSR